jgi:hypothetical protein
MIERSGEAVLFDTLLTEWEMTARQLCCQPFHAA